MVWECAVEGCANNSNSCQNIRMLTGHSFPSKSETRHSWLVKIRRDICNNGKRYKVTTSTKVCSAHFRREDYYRPRGSRRSRLKCGTFPSIFPWTKQQKGNRNAVGAGSESLNFLDLPEDVQLEIFSYLSPKELCQAVARVCTRWCQLTRNRIFWKNLSFDIKNKREWNSFIEFAERFTRPTSLKLHNTFKIGPSFKFVELPSLAVLDLCSNSQLLNVKPIVASCPNIKVLSIHVSEVYPIDLHLLAKLQSLESFTLVGSKGSPPEGFIQDVAQGCLSLREFKTGSLSDEDLQELCKHRLDTLQTLTVKGGKLSDDGIQCLTQCQKMQSLTIQETELQFTGWGLTHISKLQLKELYLDCLRFVPAGAFDLLFGDCFSNLEVLRLSVLEIDDKGLRKLADTCQNLRSIEIKYCRNIVVGMSFVVEHCKELRKINLLKLDNMTRSFLSHIPISSTKLEELVLSSCSDHVNNVASIFMRKKMPAFKPHCNASKTDWRWSRTIA